MSHLSTLKLNQYRYGELSEEEAAACRAHLSECGRCLARLQAQQNNREAFVLEPLPEALREPPPPANQPARSWLRFGLPALAAVALMLLFLPQLLSPTVPETGPDTPYIGQKGGGILLEAYLDTQEGPQLLPTGATLRPGDVLQLKYASEGRPWVSFGGVDAQGTVEVYGTFATEGLEIERAPFALELDPTPGTQHIMAVFTYERPSEADIHQALSMRRAPDDGVLRSLTFEKK